MIDGRKLDFVLFCIKDKLLQELKIERRRKIGMCQLENLKV